MNNIKTITSKSFEYKTKIIEGTPNDYDILNAEVVVRRILDLPLTMK